MLSTSGVKAPHQWCGGVKVMRYAVERKAVYCYKGLILP